METLQKADAEAKFLAVQINVGNFEKAFAEYGNVYQDRVIDMHLSVTENALKEFTPDYIVYPETALPTYLDSFFLSQPKQKKVVDFVKVHKIPLITGAYS